jgi:hypothetical protein
VYSHKHCSHAESLTPSTFTAPFPFTPGVQRSVMKTDHEEEKKQHHQDAPSCNPQFTPPLIISPFTLHQQLSPGVDMDCFMGSLSGGKEVCNRSKTLVFPPQYFVFYFCFFSLFLAFYHGTQKGGITVQVDIAMHTHFHLYFVALDACLVCMYLSCVSSAMFIMSVCHLVCQRQRYRHRTATVNIA